MWLILGMTAPNVLQSCTVMRCSNYGGLLALLPLARRLSLHTLICAPLLANAAVMALAAALAAATSAGGAAVITATLPAVGLTGATTACLQAGTFALASYFPPRYMQVFTYVAMLLPVTAVLSAALPALPAMLQRHLQSPFYTLVCGRAQAILEGQAIATNDICAALACHPAVALTSLLATFFRETAQAILEGQAVAGLGVAVASFVTIWAAPVARQAATPAHVSGPAQAYFAIATAVTIAGAAAYLYMWRLPYVRARVQSPGGGEFARSI